MKSQSEMNDFNLGNKPKLGSGFSIPEHYFDGFEDKVLKQVAARETKVLPLFVRYRKTFYAAAAILLLSLLVPIYNLVRQPSESIDDAALEQYLAYESGINQLDLISAMDESDIENITEQYVLPVPDEALEEEILDNANIEHIITE
ncbi:hypothetical protein [Flavobacterium selenitireducens]|uniref:hypothetical protein n=1 Tax=Flavobacterium selenitireducens TaxID=2722704 RepID=UPI00168AE87A|nr:hypothetical protein [Flavobacterium selenitireducens]MBD3581425.1 hypothetical protein [Flavobacterium selenitireducens]